MNVDIPMLLSPGTILADDPEPLRLEEEHLNRHIFIAGGSGSGKSKLIELLCRQLIAQGCGFTFVDPHGDGVEALLEHIAAEQVDPATVHLLRPDLEHCFSFDPFANQPKNASRLVQESWLSATVDRTVSAFLRNLSVADQEIMKRLKRWLKNVLTAVGVEIDGRHLGLTDVLVLTDPGDPDFDNLLAKVTPHLPRHVAADFRKLRETAGAKRQEDWVESTINCLREILDSLAIRCIFGQHAPSINQRDVILNRHIQLVHLRKSDCLSRDQANIIGGLIVNFLLHEAENIANERKNPHERVPHYLIIDEAERFIGEDLRMGFAELRKFRLSLCLSVQDLSSLRKGDLDLVDKVLSQCGLQMTFQQGNPEDVEFLAKAFGYGSLDFKPVIMHEVLPDGYEFVFNPGMSIGKNHQVSNSLTVSSSNTEGRNWQRQTARTIQNQISHALSERETKGRSGSTALGASHSRSTKKEWSRTDSNSSEDSYSLAESSLSEHTDSNTRTVTDSSNTSRKPGGKNTYGSGSAIANSAQSSEKHSSARNESRSNKRATAAADTKGGGVGESFQDSKIDTDGWLKTREQGKTVTHNHGISDTTGDSEGGSESDTKGLALSRGEANGENISINLQWTPLAQHDIREYLSGKLEVSIQDQLYFIMNRLASLPDRKVLVKCKGMKQPFLLGVHDVLDPYEARRLVRSEQWREDDLRQLLERIHSAHAYYFQPHHVDIYRGVQRFLLENNKGRSGAIPFRSDSDSPLS